MVKEDDKIPNLLKLIRQRANTGEFIILPHANLRRVERNISVVDIIFVLKNGDREPERDEFKEVHQSWNYAIRGQTVDSRTLRIAVAFDKNEMLIITVIPLGKRRR
jgi:hypothetical protein